MPQDRLQYFNRKARAEVIRMLHSLADKPLTDEILERGAGTNWPSIKPTMPLGQLPVYTTAEGDILVLSNTIGRYVAKNFGMMGSSLLEEALNDMVQESLFSVTCNLGKKVYRWKVGGRHPAPENKDEILVEVRDGLLKAVNFIQSVAEKRGNKFIVSDTISLADVHLFCSLEFTSHCVDDALTLTPWVKQFVQKFTSDERVKKHIAARPQRPDDL